MSLIKIYRMILFSVWHVNKNLSNLSQYFLLQSIRKSALLTAAKKAKLKNNPSRVRFAECVTVNMVNGGSPPQNVSLKLYRDSNYCYYTRFMLSWPVLRQSVFGVINL